MSAILLLAAVLGCDPKSEDDTGKAGEAPELPACVRDHPLEDAATDLACDWGRTPATIEAWCEQYGGTGCDASTWAVSRDAALCLGEEAGLDPEVSSLHAALEFDAELLRPGWYVWSATVGYGESVYVDLVNGDLLDRDTWEDTGDSASCR